MSFDGLFTKAMTEELTSMLTGGRISKIHQPYQNETIFVVRAQGQNHRLLLSAHPNYARVQLTKEAYENPSSPPMFCMLLRKHLEGYTIEKIHQPSLERMIIFEVRGRNEIGDESVKQVIVEIMGRHSNIILVDKERNMILDSIKHVSFAVNSHRAILPGQLYTFPPAQEKNSPLTVSSDDLLSKLDFNSGKLDKQLVQSFAGVSPLLAKEILHRAGLPNRNSLPTAFINVLELLKQKQYSPTITYGQKENFHCIPLLHLEGEQESFPTLSLMLDRFFYQKAERDRVKQQGNDLEKFLKNERDKNITKIKKLEETLQLANNANEYQLKGELLTANLFSVSKGMSSIEVVNYYDEDANTITVELDPLKSPSDNAQRYFTKYQKAKTAIGIVADQIEKAKEEIGYFDLLVQQIESASPKDIEEMREELVEEGYIRQKTSKKKKPTNKKPQLEEYTSSDGDSIFVGKNNKQNEYLTTRFAHKSDIWLHTKEIPGSHVVIKNSEPTKKTLTEAAILSAYYSKSRDSSSVPVDFTQVRHVKKPNGSKPGFVIYDQQQTLYVTPEIDIVRKLKK
ncbi:Rqc2 family fibronectin-binding protein [Bacillus sp. 2205SS5-2]|uniref:Rqc2 family fibronectin-binding protein n=1 Tax=Bacillus sp. 2205SS5-2 TaxID=3109031 RepID=UPI003007CD7B